MKHVQVLSTRNLIQFQICQYVWSMQQAGLGNAVIADAESLRMPSSIIYNGTTTRKGNMAKLLLHLGLRLAFQFGSFLTLLLAIVA